MAGSKDETPSLALLARVATDKRLARVKELLERYRDPRTAIEDAKGLCQEVVPDVAKATMDAGEEVFVLKMALSVVTMLASKGTIPMPDALKIQTHILLAAHQIGRERRRKAIILPTEVKH